MKNNNRFYRFLEMFPGLTAWIVLISPFIFGIFTPKALAYFMIVFDCYWLVKAVKMGSYLFASYFHMKRDNNIDWLERCKQLENLDSYIENKKNEIKKSHFLNKRRNQEELLELIALKNKGIDYQKKWDDIYHVVILPHLNDEYPILRSAIQSLIDANFPTDKTIVVLF